MASTKCPSSVSPPKMNKLFIEAETISSTPLPTLKSFTPKDIIIICSNLTKSLISKDRDKSLCHINLECSSAINIFQKERNAHNLLSQGIKLEFYISCDVIPNHHTVTYCQSQTNSSKFLAYHLRKGLWNHTNSSESVPWSTELYSHPTSQTT